MNLSVLPYFGALALSPGSVASEEGEADSDPSRSDSLHTSGDEGLLNMIEVNFLVPLEQLWITPFPQLLNFSYLVHQPPCPHADVQQYIHLPSHLESTLPLSMPLSERAVCTIAVFGNRRR